MKNAILDQLKGLSNKEATSLNVPSPQVRDYGADFHRRAFIPSQRTARELGREHQMMEELERYLERHDAQMRSRRDERSGAWLASTVPFDELLAAFPGIGDLATDPDTLSYPERSQTDMKRFLIFDLLHASEIRQQIQEQDAAKDGYMAQNTEKSQSKTKQKI